MLPTVAGAVVPVPFSDCDIVDVYADVDVLPSKALASLVHALFASVGPAICASK